MLAETADRERIELDAEAGPVGQDAGSIYIPTMQVAEHSIYSPRPGCDAPEPAWKDFPDFKDHVHPRQPTFKG